MAEFDDVSFIAPDGGDPVNYFEKTILKLRTPEGRFQSMSTVDPAAIVEAGIYLEDQIRKRTSEGMSYTGSSFIAYNDEYLKQKERAGLNTDVVNLRFTGSMLSVLTTRVTPGNKAFQIGIFDNQRQAEKAFIHDQGAYFALEHNRDLGQKVRVRFDPKKHAHHTSGFVFIPARPFLGFTQADLDQAAKIIAEFNPTDPTNPFGFTTEELAMEDEATYEAPRPKKRKKIQY